MTKTALLRCNWHSIQSTNLQCTIQWFLVYSQSCANITPSNFRIHTSLQILKRRRLCKGTNRRNRELLRVALGSIWDFPDGLDSNVGDPGSIPGSGRSPGGGNGYTFQYSCLENSIDRGIWWVTVHGVPQSQKWLSVRTHTHTPISWLIHFQMQDPVSKTPVKNVSDGLKIMGMAGRSSSMILRR